VPLRFALDGSSHHDARRGDSLCHGERPDVSTPPEAGQRKCGGR
jgi:hypothetical protein